MIAILGVLMLPAVATLDAAVRVPQPVPSIGDLNFNLRASLLGVSLAVMSAQLPFAIWNLKGYLDTIPRDLEEAAAVDGATQNQTFLRVVLPLATPALAVTGVPRLPRRLDRIPYHVLLHRRQCRTGRCRSRSTAMVGQFARNTPWSEFAAFAILFALPVSLVFFFFQRYLVGGLAVGGVKG